MKALGYVAATVLAMGATAATAGVVEFNGTPSLSWADGTFTHNLSGTVQDGFDSLSLTSAYNGFGQDGLQIIFNSTVTLNSLELGRCFSCFDSTPSAFIVNLLDAGNNILSTGSTGDGAPQLLTFNQAGVKSLLFTFVGNTGNPYNDGRSVAWYTVSNVTYDGVNVVPEPAAWAMMIAGFGLVGATLRMRRGALAA